MQKTACMFLEIYLSKLKETTQNERTKLDVRWSVLAVDYIKNGVVALSMADS